MAKFTMEQIDYLREKAAISYEEAVEVLEKNDGDLAHCMVDLERRGRLKPQVKKAGGRANYNPFAGMEGTAEQVYQKYQQSRSQGYQGQSQGTGERPKAFVLDPAWLKSTLFSRVVVRKNDTVVVNLPVLLILIAFILAFPVSVALVILTFLMGCTIKWERPAAKDDRANDLYTFVDKTAENIRRTTDSFVETFKNEVRPQEPRPEDQAEYGTTKEPEAKADAKAKKGKPGDIAVEADAAEGESTEGEYTVE